VTATTNHQRSLTETRSGHELTALVRNRWRWNAPWR